jgi:hypothetical protein
MNPRYWATAWRLPLRMILAASALILGLGATAAPPVLAHAAACPASPITLREIMNLYDSLGPLAQRYPPAVAWINEAGRDCLGGSTLRFRAFVNGTGGIGGSSAYSIRPRWFLGASLIVFASDREVEPGVGRGTFYGIAVPPGFGDLQTRYHRRWVMITAHFGDSRSQRCRADGVPGETPSRREAIGICRSMLVLSSIEPAGRVGAPDTATDGRVGSREEPSGQTTAAIGAAGTRPSGLAWLLLAPAVMLGAWSGWRRTSRPVVRGRP